MDDAEITRRLADYFPPEVIGWKPQTVKGDRALAAAYIDVRDVMDRLDAVVGVGNWQDVYEVLADGSVMCRLTVRLGDREITKSDVGSTSDQPDAGDRMKAAFSDALKRTAVKFGIGRYLYRLPHQWADWDAQKRQFKGTPRLPDWAIPGKTTTPRRDAPAQANGSRPAHREPPKTGQELHQRVGDADVALSRDGRAKAGELLAHVVQAGVKAGFGADMYQWQGPAIDMAVKVASDFVRARNK